MLAGAIFAVVDRALRAAPHVLAHAAIDLVLRLVALGHRVLIAQGLRIAPSSVPAFAGTDRCCTEATGSTAGRETPPAPNGPCGGRFLGGSSGQVKFRRFSAVSGLVGPAQRAC